MLVREGPPTKQYLSRWLEEPVPDKGNSQDKGGSIHGLFEEYPRKLVWLQEEVRVTVIGEEGREAWGGADCVGP